MEEIQKKSEPRWERRKDARPAELLAAALALFVEKGYAATRLEDVAARAGVSKGTLYLYFDNKEALFKAVVQEGLVPVIEEGEALIRDYQGSAADLLRHIVTRWWESIGATHFAGVIKLMMSEAQNFPEAAEFHYEQVVTRGKRIFAFTVDLGIKQGEFRAVSTPYCVRVLLAPLLMLAIWRYSLGVCDREPVDANAYLETYLDMALAGLAAPSAPQAGEAQ